MTTCDARRPRTKQEWFFYDESVALLRALNRGAGVFATVSVILFVLAVADRPNSVAFFWGFASVVWVAVAWNYSVRLREMCGRVEHPQDDSEEVLG